MTPPSLSEILADERCGRPPVTAAADVFAGMDADYDAVARHHGFHCVGCKENCCRTRFYHHTLTEAAYLFEGYRALDRDVFRHMAQRAQVVTDAMAHADATGAVFSSMCPVNVEGRCLLYAHRPMICRLHGLPSIMTLPDGASRPGVGCDDFHRRHGGGDDFRLDRTPHYIRMAHLEQQVRQATRWTGRLKLTVAEMIGCFEAALEIRERRLDE